MEILSQWYTRCIEKAINSTVAQHTICFIEWICKMLISLILTHPTCDVKTASHVCNTDYVNRVAYRAQNSCSETINSWSDTCRTENSCPDIKRTTNSCTDTCRTENSCPDIKRTTNSCTDTCRNTSSNTSREITKDDHTYFSGKYWRNCKTIIGTLFRVLMIVSLIRKDNTSSDISNIWESKNASYSDYLSCNKFSNVENKLFYSLPRIAKDHNIVFGMHRSANAPKYSSYCEIELFPASFDPYFDEVKSDKNLTIEEIMKYEWNRLRSFRTFPIDSPVYAIHLARAGFYYNGHADDVVCFSCGVRHSQWKSGDSPINVHRNISPNCPFINGDDPRNVPVSNITTGPELNRHETSQYKKPNCSGACGCHSASESENSHTHGKNIATCNIPDARENILIVDNAESNSGIEGLLAHTVGQEHACLPSQLRNASNLGVFSRSEDSTVINTAESGNCSEKPKYPRYAVLVIRISSFNGWPVYSRITPRSLAQAGLFYVGFGDCVRCFFCGGGLRNWETQDDPWVEHARWFPRCPYVIQSQGNEFVNAVQHQVLEQQFGSISFTQDITQPEAGLDEVSLPLNDVDDRSSDSDIYNSTAAQSAMEMGYSRDAVQAAIIQLSQQTGTVVFSAQTLLTFILENEESEAESTAMRAHGNERKNTTHGHKEKHDSEKEPDNGIASTIDECTLSLVQENRQLKEQGLCKICFKEPCCIVMLPCGHLVTCPQCAKALRKCPICRRVIKGTVKAYIS